MDAFLAVLPLALLVVAVTVVIWRGMSRKPDGANNAARGGGSESHHDG